jgi:hypothetical protein
MQTESSLNGNKDETSFFSIDDNLETSLSEFGMVMRNTRSDEYEVYFRVAEGLYGWGLICRSDIEDIINEKSWVPKEKIDFILSESQQTKESFLSMPIELQILSIRLGLGHTNTFGKTIETYTLDEVLKIIEKDSSVEEVEEIEEQEEEQETIEN